MPSSKRRTGLPVTPKLSNFMTLFQILKLENFRRLWLGQAISQFGDAFYMLVFLFMVNKITHDPAKVGLVMAGQALPFIVLSFFAGATADRHDRRRIMLGCDLLSFLVLGLFGAWLFLDPVPEFWMLFLVPFLLSTINVFFAPAKSASIPRVVPSDRLTDANSLSTATQSLMPLVGIGLSAGALTWVEAVFPDRFLMVAVLINGLTFLLSALFIRQLPAIKPQRDEADQNSASHDTVAGLRYLWNNKVLLTTAFVGASSSFFIAPFMLTYVEVNDRWFGGEFRTLAICEGAFSASMLIGAMLTPQLKVRKPGKFLVVGTILLGGFVLWMGYSPQFPIFVILNILCGIVVPMVNIPLSVYVQRVVPDTHMGRVQSVLAMAAMTTVPIANALAGFALPKLGLTGMFVAMGGGLALSAAVAGISRPFWHATMPADGA